MTITDHRVRAAVWHSPASGEWRVEVYYAARRRRRRVSVVLRADFDRDLSTEPVRRSFPDRLEALDWAAGTVGVMRLACSLAVGTVPARVAAAAWARAGAAGLEAVAPEPMEAP